MLEGDLIEVSRLLNQLWRYGLKHQCSDIYFLPGTKGYVIKVRFYDRLLNYRAVSLRQGIKCINYCKFHGGMNISEHRRPQLGSMMLTHQCSLRFSTVGDYHNRESMVVRLIKKLSDRSLTFLIPDQFTDLLSLARHRGLMLFSGPTGAGKTTTIYKLAEQLGRQKMVMTIEDPVEIINHDFLQLQINQQAGMTYQQLLKVGLRHRPDIFIIGEIRDSGTANAAVQAALSGHLVLSTVHAKSPEGVVDRLLQLNVDRHYLQQCLNSASYQRLLPLSRNRTGALFNIVTNDQLWRQPIRNDSLKEWRGNLSELVKEQKIDPKVYSQYKFG